MGVEEYFAMGIIVFKINDIIRIKFQTKQKALNDDYDYLCKRVDFVASGDSRFAWLALGSSHYVL